MSSRGQTDFVRMPGFGARLYQWLTQSRAVDRQHKDIARDLTSLAHRGRLLDIGTGPGQLLAEMHSLNPQFELFGLDISSAMIELAKTNLSGIDVDLRCADVRVSGYPDDYFDLVTCTGSLYLWDSPADCLDEVFRILKPGRSACLFETHSDFDEADVQRALRTNLEGENWARKLIAPRFLMKQLRMTY
jgi:ubiquinone/menaquinone biosynthesis C-methylase UbiE